ncbi:MAG: DoxX family protein [Acidimicrobiia bacterium]|nr:DoxX family protein [Acidimicrobiia bacterium]
MPDTINAALLVLRVGLGVVFLAHGVKHARGRTKTANWFGSIGFTSPDLQWLLSTATEIGVGVLLILGLLTGPAAAGVIGIMTVAYWTVHRSAGFFITAFMKDDVEVEGYEYVATLCVIALALALAGPGEFSLDHAIDLSGVTLAEYFDGRAGLVLALAGVALAALQLLLFWRPERD